MNIGSTLKMLRKQKGMSGKQLGRLAGCNQSTVSRKEAGEDCDEYLMMMFAQALGVQPSVFEKSKDDAMKIIVASHVPLIQWSDIPNPEDYDGGVHDWSSANVSSWFSCPVAHGERSFALVVSGEGMRNDRTDPSFKTGDIIFVDPARQPVNNSLVIVRHSKKDPSFKRLLLEGPEAMLESLNPDWPNRIIPIPDNAKICGVVIAKLQTFI